MSDIEQDFRDARNELFNVIAMAIYSGHSVVGLVPALERLIDLKIVSYHLANSGPTMGTEGRPDDK